MFWVIDGSSIKNLLTLLNHIQIIQYNLSEIRCAGEVANTFFNYNQPFYLEFQIKLVYTVSNNPKSNK